jgi:hypothetical protein
VLIQEHNNTGKGSTEETPVLTPVASDVFTPVDNDKQGDSKLCDTE